MSTILFLPSVHIDLLLYSEGGYGDIDATLDGPFTKSCDVEAMWGLELASPSSNGSPHINIHGRLNNSIVTTFESPIIGNTIGNHFESPMGNNNIGNNTLSRSMPNYVPHVPELTLRNSQPNGNTDEWGKDQVFISINHSCFIILFVLVHLV